MDDLSTIEEVAEQLRRPVGTLRQWRAKGKGPRSFRVGGRLMYRSADVEEWLRTQVEGSSKGGA